MPHKKHTNHHATSGAHHGKDHHEAKGHGHGKNLGARQLARIAAAEKAENERKAAEAKAEKARIAAQEEQFQEDVDRWHAGPVDASPEPLRVPFAKNVAAKITSDYGDRDIDYGSRNHKGIDMIPLSGDGTVTAAARGTVLFSGVWNGDLGNAVIIGHDDRKTITVYGHFKSKSQQHLVAGMRVAQGDAIGMMGKTGNPHSECLHFLIRKMDDDMSAGDITASVNNNPEMRLIEARGYKLLGPNPFTNKPWREAYEYVEPLVNDRRVNIKDVIPAGTEIGMRKPLPSLKLPSLPKAPQIDNLDDLIESVRDKLEWTRNVPTGSGTTIPLVQAPTANTTEVGGRGGSNR